VGEAMRKILQVILVIISLLLLVGQLRAEDYVNNDFPSDEILMKNLQTLCNSFKISKLIGKYQDKDGAYHIITMVEGQGAPRMHSTTVIRLDTNIWIANPARCDDGVVQK
jgi:hypothetical protein